MQIIAQWQRSVAPPEALVVLYWVMRAKLHRRIHMVIEMASKPIVFFSFSTREYSSRITISKLIYCLKKNKHQRARAHRWAGCTRVRLGVSA